MRKKHFKITLYPLLLLAALILVNCGGSSSSGSSGDEAGVGSGSSVTYIPTWINASWSGGAAGAPNDRTDIEAENWSGSICPASSVLLSNWDSTIGNVLNIVNNCTLTITFAVCVASGSLPQPEIGGLSQCATDPMQTSFSSLSFYTISPGSEGDFINSTQALAVNIFYCSSSQSLNALGQSLTCI